MPFWRRERERSGPFVSVVIAAGGKGRRMGADINKIFLELCECPVLAHTLLAFERCALVDEIIIATSEDDMLGCRDIVEEFGISKVRTITKGGDKRTHTVQAGLCEISAEADVVLIHDAARPLVREEHIREVIQNVIQHGAAALGVPAKNTIKQVDADGFITATLDREYVWEVQTPQGFRPGLIRDAYARAEADGVSGTDDCFIAERSGIPIKMVRGEYDNLKITTPEDLAVAEQLLLGEEPLI